jgi:uncharacterized protein with PIN domain
MEIQNQINREIPELMATGFPTRFGEAQAPNRSDADTVVVKNGERIGRVLKIFRRTDLVSKGAKARPLFEHDSSNPRHTNEGVEKWLGCYLTGCRSSRAPHFPSERRRNRCEICGKSLQLVSRERAKSLPNAADEVKAAGMPPRKSKPNHTKPYGYAGHSCYGTGRAGYPKDFA